MIEANHVTALSGPPDPDPNHRLLSTLPSMIVAYGVRVNVLLVLTTIIPRHVPKMPALTSHTAPVIDEENPLYCPSISAVAFLESVRKKVYSNKRLHSSARTPDLSRTTDELFFPSFHNMLDKSLTEEDLLRLHYFPANAAMFPTRTRHDSSSSSLEADSLRSIPSWKNKAGTYNTSSKPSKRHVPSKRSRPSHVHTSDSFSEFRGPFRREKSAMTVNDGSFELSARAERLHYFPVKASFSPYEPMPQRNRELPEDQLTEKVRNLEGNN